MAPIDGAISMKINLDLPQTTDVNISKAQPSKASGLGGVRCLKQAFFFNRYAALEATWVAGKLSFEFENLRFDISDLSFEILSPSFDNLDSISQSMLFTP